MITVRITCDTGCTWTTDINASYREALNYFMGQTFVTETDDGEETRHRVIDVDLITVYY